jgi:hypothetical protein
MSQRENTDWLKLAYIEKYAVTGYGMSIVLSWGQFRWLYIVWLTIPKYHTVGTIPKYHTVGTIPKYHTVGTIPKYHTVGTIRKYHTVETIQKYHTVGTILKYHTVGNYFDSVVF